MMRVEALRRRKQHRRPARWILLRAMMMALRRPEAVAVAGKEAVVAVAVAVVAVAVVQWRYRYSPVARARHRPSQLQREVMKVHGCGGSGGGTGQSR